VTMQNMVQIQIIVIIFFVFHYPNGDQEDLSIFLYEPIGSCMGIDENLKGLLNKIGVLTCCLIVFFCLWENR
jgi:hypothetical protein